MKNVIYNISIILLLALVAGCKKDLGNYAYTDTDVPTIDTAGLGGVHSVLRYTKLVLDPKINAPQQSDLRYEWLLYSRTRTSTSVPSVIRLSSQAKLDTVIDVAIGNYTVELVVTDGRTGYKSNALFAVDVASSMDYGMFVLYQKGAGGDVDFIKTPANAPSATAPTHIRNILSSTLGEPLTGAPKFIWASRFSTVNFITVGSGTYLGRFHGDDFSFLRQQRELFRRTSPTIQPEAYVYTSAFYNVLINAGKMQVTNITIEPDAKFGGEAAGNYRLAPYLTDRVSSSLQAVAYDELNGRFVRYFASSNSIIDFAAPANADQPFDLRSVGKDMLWMTGGANNYTYSFFKDRDGGSRWMYVTNFGGFAFDNGQLAIGRYNMTTLPEIANAKRYLVSGFGLFAYYATDDKIYNYTYAANNSATVAFRVPAGEQITAMEFFRPRPNAGLSDREERVLYVATWNGTKGKVYELSINETSGVVGQEPNHVFEVDGKIAFLTSKTR